MSNCLLAWPDYTLSSASHTPTVTGGSWQSTLPLGNLLLAPLSRKARSTNATEAFTYFDIDLITARGILLIALLRHNCSAAATVRIKGSTVSNFNSTVYDSGAVTLWPEGYPTAENRLGYQADFYLPLPSVQTARYWRVAFSDTGNTSGYVELARCCLMAAWQPTLNMIYGAALGLETDTTSDRALGGATYFDRREPRRVQKFTLENLAEGEAFDRAFKMQWQLGIDGEILFCHDPAATGERLKQRTFLATLRQLTAIEYPYTTAHRTAFELLEKL